jgi:putative radical SAM enzyme (TIGR03279 family)
MSRGYQVTGIKKGSPAAKAGVEVRDYLLKINNSFFYDLIDYHYLCADEILSLSMRKRDGSLREIRLKKRYDQDPGLEFNLSTIGPLRSCKNNCIFCFVDQQPPGLRPSLYEKDDDYRLSFLHGNYITLTNTGDLDLKRIYRRGLSPIYISIHSTDPQIRRKMMRNSSAGEIMGQLKSLAQKGIEMHGQVVVCPGINDGVHLKKTVYDLSHLFPNLESVALVPVGLTKYRQHLAPIKSVTHGDASEIVETYSEMQGEFMEKLGVPFVYLADEFYHLSGSPLPSHRHYGNYRQIENGVGLGRLFLNELEDLKNKIDLISLKQKIEISFVTAQSGEPYLKLLVNELTRIKGLKAYLYVVPHLFWGGNVSVTGLLTGSDLLESLHRKPLGSMLFLPRVMLKESTDLFLDGLSLNFLENKLNVQIAAVDKLDEIRGFLISKTASVIS